MSQPPMVAAAATAIALAGLGLSTSATAACTGPSLNQIQLTALLTGNTVCAIRTTDRWQELHVNGGDLIDYKRGPGHPVDPSASVGRWSIVGSGANNATVVYNYGGGGTFTFRVFSVAGNSYSFCDGAAELLATVISGGGPCP